MRYDLPAMIRRARPNLRRRAITIRDIAPPAVLATNLYRAAYLPVVEAWQRAIPAILAEYERTLSGMTTDTANDLQSRLDAANSDLERVFILLNAALRDWTVSVETWQRGKWRGAVLSATGVDIGTLIGPEDMRATLGTYLNWNAGLVRKVSGEIRDKISSAVFAGLQNRTPVADVSKSISEATGLARDRSKRIAADMLSKTSSAIASERRREAGISTWRWKHSMKLHPRTEHLARNNNIYTEDPAMVGRVVGGQTVMAAPDERDLPGRPPFCGCRELSVIILDD